jgi:chromosomal replication initiator protein
VVNGVFDIPFSEGYPDSGSGSFRSRNHARAVPAFVAGPENRLVRVAVDSALNDHGDGYSPLVFYGPSGTGKSHLALGVAAAWRTRFRKQPVIHVTATDFARELAEAIQTKTGDDFALRCRGVALLVVDDVQHLARKPYAQRELTLTLDALTEGGGRAVLTANRLPSELAEIMPGLRSRLGAGLAVPVSPPGPEAREVILPRLAATLGVELSEAAARVLAEGLDGTVPSLSAALSQLQLSTGVKAVIDEGAVEDYLAGRAAPGGPSVDQIAATTAQYFRLPLRDLRSASRRRSVATARAVAMYLARNLTQESLHHVGEYFGGRDHTTVAYSCQKTEERLNAEPEIRRAVVSLQETLRQKAVRAH